jgi:murein DD-endopeptidase MepM/ murein hydrolase activator NlpD
MQKYVAFFKKLAGFFRGNGNDERGLMEKLRDKYKLVVMNHDTFEEVLSFKLSPLSVYVLFSSLIVGTATLVTLLIVFTPLKRYIPGYGDFVRDAEIAALNKKVSDLEEEMEANRAYTANLRKILSGDMADFSREAAAKESDAAPPDSVNAGEAERIPEDDALRASVAAGSFSTPPPVAAAGISTIESRETPLEQIYFVPPVTGEVTAVFDPSKQHYGTDVGAPRNTAIKSVADGTVISAGYTVETGYSIAIQHPHNVVTMYKHNSVLLKKAGSTVKAGEAIALIGNTGEATSGPHLHFELWHRGRPINPDDYINFK